jgi:hypothetical protein
MGDGRIEGLNRTLIGLVVSLAVTVACDGAGAVAPAETSPGTRTSSSIATGTASSAATTAPAGSAAPSASAPPAAASSAAPAIDLARAPELLDEAGNTLPQTKDRPSVESAAFKKRMELVWRAIVTDDPAIAESAFFPDVAYAVVKDIEKPKADWKHRLMKNFHRDVHAYHKELGAEPESLTFVGADIKDDRVKWMDVGKEGNKVGYFRVTRSKLRYKDPSGAEKELELTSLISWRGEWFVVHLHGFK